MSCLQPKKRDCSRKDYYAGGLCIIQERALLFNSNAHAEQTGKMPISRILYRFRPSAARETKSSTLSEAEGCRSSTSSERSILCSSLRSEQNWRQSFLLAWHYCHAHATTYFREYRKNNLSCTP